MAYGVTYSPSQKAKTWTHEAGRKFYEVTITQTEVDPAVKAEHQWSIDLPKICTVLRHTVEVTDDAGGTVTQVAPELGVDDGWTADTVDQVSKWDWGTGTPGLFADSRTELVVSSAGTLYGRAVPNVSGGTIVTRLLIMEGIPSGRST